MKRYNFRCSTGFNLRTTLIQHFLMRFTSYVDYITSYIIGDDIDQVALTLEDLAVNLFKRFSGSKMKPNPEK